MVFAKKIEKIHLRMLRTSLIVFTFVCFFLTNYGQQHPNIDDYIGLWKGVQSQEHPFKINVIIKEKKNGNATITLSNKKELLTKSFTLNDTLNIQLDEKISFTGILNKKTSSINGFVKLGFNLYPIILEKRNKQYQGICNLAAYQYLQSESLYLTIRKVDNSEAFTAYPFLGTYWVEDFEVEKDKISFIDYKTGLLFEGHLQASQIELTISLNALKLDQIIYHKVDKKEKGKKLVVNDGWKNAKTALAIPQLEQDINANILEGVESVLVAQNGRLYYENYFEGTNTKTTNDLRSAGKSIGSAMIGIAIDDGIIKNVQENVYDYLPAAYQYTKDEEKSKIKIKDLLTMSSGIGVYEDDYQQSQDWLKMVLEPKLKYPAGSRTNYMSSDPFLLSVNLSERLSSPLELYMQEKLFLPLEISNYVLNMDDKGNPYFAGGLNMMPRDMLKFGQLYLNKGVWNGERIISEKWVNASFEKHTRLENTSKKNAYGYFWWHETYQVNERSIQTIEARGNGGQYISIIPELDVVIVVTTENYNNRRLSKQTELIIEKYILPRLVE